MNIQPNFLSPLKMLSSEKQKNTSEDEQVIILRYLEIIKGLNSDLGSLFIVNSSILPMVHFSQLVTC